MITEPMRASSDRSNCTSACSLALWSHAVFADFRRIELSCFGMSFCDQFLTFGFVA